MKPISNPNCSACGHVRSAHDREDLITRGMRCCNTCACDCGAFVEPSYFTVWRDGSPGYAILLTGDATNLGALAYELCECDIDAKGALEENGTLRVCIVPLDGTVIVKTSGGKLELPWVVVVKSTVTYEVEGFQ